MLELEAALARILTALPAPLMQRVALSSAAGRILAEDVFAPIALPPFDNSAMDGYAVKAADTTLAGATAPVALQLVGRVAAGAIFNAEVTTGQCVRLFTGSPLPRGADAVVMQEGTRVSPDRPEEVLIRDRVQTGENVRPCGDDVSVRTKLVAAGEVLTAARLGLLAAVGLGEVSVGRQPIVGLLATGSELRECGEPLAPGQIYESNRAALAPLIAQAGGRAKIFPLVPDSVDATQSALEAVFAECDVVVTSGGVSVGEMDFVKAAFEAMGGELQFWKVAMRPGKPFVFGRCGGKFLFGLPGNPVSAFVTFLLLVRPALRRWQGATEVALPAQVGLAGETFSNSGDRRHFLRVRVDHEGKVFSAGRQASHALSSLATANALLSLLPGALLSAGMTVKVLRWD